MVDWGRLLSGYWGEIFSRRFESCPPRKNTKRAVRRVLRFAMTRQGAFSPIRANPAAVRVKYLEGL